MRRPKKRPPIGFRQVCAIATSEMRADPTIDDAEWKARIKARVIALEFTYPVEKDAIDQAMTQVEKMLERQWGPRPIPLPPTPPVPTATAPLNRVEAAVLMRQLLANWLPSVSASSRYLPSSALLARGFTSLAAILGGAPRADAKNQTAEQV